MPHGCSHGHAMTEPRPHSFVVTADLDNGGTLVLRVRGDFDALAVTSFDDAAAAALDDGVGAVRVDIGGATLVDSSALGALVRLRATAVEHGLEFALHAPRPFQRRLLEITGLERLLGVEKP